MIISELIKNLERLKAEHGDVEVLLHDDDYGISRLLITSSMMFKIEHGCIVISITDALREDYSYKEDLL